MTTEAQIQAERAESLGKTSRFWEDRCIRSTERRVRAEAQVRDARKILSRVFDASDAEKVPSWTLILVGNALAVLTDRCCE